jgi:hypothetical protein
MFMKILRKKRLEMMARDWLVHWDNAPVHTVTKVMDWLVARNIMLIEHLPYLPDLARAVFFLIPKVKRELASLTLTQETFKKEWEGPVRSIAAADFAEAFHWWFQCHEKCVTVSGRYIEKSVKKKKKLS